MTGMPLATASLIAPVTLLASEQEIRIALAPLLTAFSMFAAWTWPSSWAGVSQSICTSTPSFSLSSLAAASAPDLADRKTGLVVLLAIIPILSEFAAGFSVLPVGAVV